MTVRAQEVILVSPTEIVPLTGNEPCFDTAILGGDPIGRKDIGFNVASPAQLVALQQVVNEKIIAHSSTTFEIKSMYGLILELGARK